MIILDPGHIYQIASVGGAPPIDFKFIKRGGGAIQYVEEWPGIQTQAVMRAVIDYLSRFPCEEDVVPHSYELWQLGLNSPAFLTISNMEQIPYILDVLIDRSRYLNGVLVCTETNDAITWMELAECDLLHETDNFLETCNDAANHVRLALFCYEARAYRRKQEEVNRKQPEHDDTASPKPWRVNPYYDVPFNEEDIELRSLGPDGHIVLEKS